MTKAAFLKKYAHCAAAEVLKKIWEAKESGRRGWICRGINIYDLGKRKFPKPKPSQSVTFAQILLTNLE